MTLYGPDAVRIQTQRVWSSRGPVPQGPRPYGAAQKESAAESDAADYLSPLWRQLLSGSCRE